MKTPMYAEYLAEQDPGRKLAMLVLVGTRPEYEEVDRGWPIELFTKQITRQLATEALR